MERHPLWKIPLGCFTLFLLIAVFGGILFTVISASFRQSDIYKRAVAMAQGSLHVREEIGEPIEVGRFISGQLNINGSSGQADLSIPISGPRGRGHIRAVATKRGGVWTFTWLQVMVDGHSDAIDLLSDLPNPGS